MKDTDKIDIESINTPGQTTRVGAEKYHAMRDILLEILPKSAPGLTAEEMLEAMKPLLPQELWPNGEKSGWWQKTVQLDLEAKGILVRDRSSKPLRWWQTC